MWDIPLSGALGSLARRVARAEPYGCAEWNLACGETRVSRLDALERTGGPAAAHREVQCYARHFLYALPRQLPVKPVGTESEIAPHRERDEPAGPCRRCCY